jgi:hypothetical protein
MQRHHRISIKSRVHFNLSKSVDIQYHLEYIFDNLIANGHLCWSLIDGYLLDAYIKFLHLIHLIHPSCPLAHRVVYPS